jgi:hypothetical protein
MNARVLFILLVIALLLAFSHRYRQLGLGLSGVLLLLLAWSFTHLEHENIQPANTSAGNSSSRSTAVPAQLSAMKLAGNGAPWQLTGSVQNTGSTAIRALTLSIERVDCAADSVAQADCAVVWRGTHVARIDLAAGASAKLDERFYSHEELPRLQGVARDHITLVATN